MAHFGIICPPYSGHLNPLSALGRELKARGHQVTVLQISDLEAKVRSEGLTFHSIGESIYQPGSLAASFQELTRLSEIAALHYSVEFCRHMAEIICRDAPAAISAAGIDILIVDQLEPTGQTIAQALNLPWICVSSGQVVHRRADMPPFFTPWSYQNAAWARLRNQLAYYILDRSCQPILQTINAYRHRWRLPDYYQIYSVQFPLLHLSQQPATFEFPDTHRSASLRYVGPFRNTSPQPVAFPFEQLTGQPLIYASLGSVQNTKQEIFRCIAAACEGLDVQLVITHGGGLTADAIRALPGSPLVVEYAPQLEVLARASLTITHGGLNTVLDSLSYGVPLVAIPITFEQPGTGARIRWTKTGEVVPLSQLTSEKLRAAIQQVFAQEHYRKNAYQLQQAIRQAGGVQRAADLIEQVLPSRQLMQISF